MEAKYPEPLVYPTATLYQDGVMELDDEVGKVYPVVDTTAPYFFCAPARVFQVHPKKGRGEMLAEDVAWFLPVASNEATKEVSMIVKCGDVQFFTKWSDPCVKIAKQEYMFLLPADAIGIEIRDVAAEVVTQFDTMLAQKTEFSEDDDTDSLLREDEFSKEERKMLYPDDGTSQKIMEMTGWLTHRILKVSAATAEKVESCGEKKTAGITESVGDISASHIARAQTVRRISEKANKFITNVSNKVSKRVGGTLVKHTEAREGDGEWKAWIRQLALSSLLSYNELSDSLAEGYMLVLGSTKEQSQGYVEKKYGKNAKQVVGDSTAAVINVGHAALVTRRVISVKKVLTSNVKYIAKKKVENFSESARQKSSQVEK